MVVIAETQLGAIQPRSQTDRRIGKRGRVTSNRQQPPRFILPRAYICSLGRRLSFTVTLTATLTVTATSVSPMETSKGRRIRSCVNTISLLLTCRAPRRNIPAANVRVVPIATESRRVRVFWSWIKRSQLGVRIFDNVPLTPRRQTRDSSRTKRVARRLFQSREATMRQIKTRVVDRPVPFVHKSPRTVCSHQTSVTPTRRRVFLSFQIFASEHRRRAPRQSGRMSWNRRNSLIKWLLSWKLWRSAFWNGPPSSLALIVNTFRLKRDSRHSMFCSARLYVNSYLPSLSDSPNSAILKENGSKETRKLRTILIAFILAREDEKRRKQSFIRCY